MTEHGVKIPNQMVSGDAAAGLVADLHERAELSGYSRVRLDRGMHETGAWYELGYSYGEIKIRLSHMEDYVITKIDETTSVHFETMLYHNTAKAKTHQHLRPSKGKKK